MKIAFVTPYALPEKGAPVTRAIYLREFFSRKGMEMRVISLRKDYIPAAEQEKEGVVRFGKWRELISIFKKEGFDAVIATAPPTTMIFYSIIAARLAGIPVIADVRDLGAEYKTGENAMPGYRVFLHHLMDKFSYRMADRISCVSGHIRNVIIRDYGIKRGKVFVAPHAVDLKKFCKKPKERKKVRKSLGIPAGSPVAVFVGSMYGGLDVFVKECGLKLAKQGVHFLFLLNYDKHSEQYKKRLIRAVGKSKKFHILYNVEHRDIPKFLSAADMGIGLFPDAFSYLILGKLPEYLACEVPLVCKCPPGGAMSSLLKKESIGVPVHDWDEMRKSIEKTIKSNALRRGLIKNGLSYVKRDRDVEIVGERLLKELNALLKGR